MGRVDVHQPGVSCSEASLIAPGVIFTAGAFTCRKESIQPVARLVGVTATRVLYGDSSVMKAGNGPKSSSRSSVNVRMVGATVPTQVGLLASHAPWNCLFRALRER